MFADDTGQFKYVKNKIKQAVTTLKQRLWYYAQIEQDMACNCQL